MLNLDQKNVLVVGLKKTGVALTHFLIKRNAKVTVTDVENENRLGAYLADIRGLDIKIELGPHNPKTFDVFSCGRLAVMTVGDPTGSGYEAYQSAALTPNSSDTGYVHDGAPVNGEVNRYLGNW